MHKEDQHLIDVLERLVPELDQAYDDLAQPFETFLDAHMLPKINDVLRELAKQDHEQFSEGRRALGVSMEPLPDHASDQEVESNSEEEELDNEEGSSSEDDSD